MWKRLCLRSKSERAPYSSDWDDNNNNTSEEGGEEGEDEDDEYDEEYVPEWHEDYDEDDVDEDDFFSDDDESENLERDFSPFDWTTNQVCQSREDVPAPPLPVSTLLMMSWEETVLSFTSESKWNPFKFKLFWNQFRPV